MPRGTRERVAATPRAATAVSAAAAIAVGIVHLVLADPSRGPRIMADEAGYLANAIFLATGEVVNLRDTAFMSGGYSVLITPIAWFAGDDRLALYRTVIVLQCVLAALVTLTLIRMVRSLFGVDVWTSIAAGVTAGLYPAYVMHSGLGWAEAVLTALVTFSLAATLRMLRSAPEASITRAISLGLPTGLAFGAMCAVHRRTLLPALVAMVVLAAWAVAEKRLRVLVAVWVPFALVVVSGSRLDSHLRDRIWGTSADLELSSKVASLGTRDGAVSFLGAVTGQSWYLLVGTAGLAGTAVAAAVWTIRRSVRVGSPDQHPAAWFSLVVLAVLFPLIGVSAVFVVGATHQAEYLHYGRYPEVVAPVLVAMGIGWLRVAPVRAILTSFLAVGTALVTTWAVLVSGYRDWLDRSLNRVNVAATIDWLLVDRPAAPLLRGTVVALVALAVVSGLAATGSRQEQRRRWIGPTLGAVVVTAVFAWQLASIRTHIVVPLRVNGEIAERRAAMVRDSGAEHLGVPEEWGRGPRVALSYRLPGVVIDTDDGTQCRVLVDAAAPLTVGAVIADADGVALVDRPGPCDE